MVIKKILNNNCVVGVDHNNREFVVMGNGVAFRKMKNDVIDPNHIQKIFVSKSSGMTQKLSNIASNVPVEYVKVTDEIVNRIRRENKINLNDLVYLSLCDHIAFAIQRFTEGSCINATFLWEVKNLFPTEYQCGLLALEVIGKRFDISLPEDEAGFIALHVINASSEQGKSIFKETVKIVQNLLTIVKSHMRTPIDENSISYQRLMTHLRFFAKRILDSENSDIYNLDSMFDSFVETYGDENLDCVEEITRWIHDNCKYIVSKDEKLYLLIHLKRCLQKMNNYVDSYLI